MRYCTNCGSVIPDNAQHCPKCGKSLDRKRASPVPFYLVGFMLIIASIVSFIRYSQNQLIFSNQINVSPSQIASTPTRSSPKTTSIIASPTVSPIRVPNTSEPNSPTKRPTATAIGTTTLPPAVTPEQFFASSDIKDAVISGEVFKVNMRKLPGYQDKINEIDVIVEVPTGSQVKVLGGPEVADGLNWWYVEWMNYKGWIAETTRTGKIILVFEK